MDNATTITPEHTELTELGDQLGDDVLLTVAATTKVATVTRAEIEQRRHNTWRQASQSRAWTARGNVD